MGIKYWFDLTVLDYMQIKAQQGSETYTHSM